MVDEETMRPCLAQCFLTDCFSGLGRAVFTDVCIQTKTCA